MHKRAAFLARVSTERQREEATIDSQIAEIKQKISDDGNILVVECQYIDEGYTGELLARPALDRMRDDAKRRLFEVLYVYDRGRLSRKYAYQELIIDELADAGIAFVTLHDANAETPEERILQSMQGVFHEYERMKIAERFRRGKLYKVQSGKLLGYPAKYGYRYVTKSEDEEGHFEIDEQEAAVVRRIFELAADGASARRVVLWLHEQGIMPRKGRRSTWHRGTISNMLRDETYIGTHYYNKRECVVAKRRRNPEHYSRVKKTSSRERSKDQWIPISVPAIIDRETFDRVARQIEFNARFADRNRKREYLLTGLVWCPCGYRRNGHPASNSTRTYYRSNAKVDAFPLATTCACKGINGRLLDEAVWTAVKQAVTDRNMIRAYAEKWLHRKRMETGEQSAAGNQVERLQGDLKKLADEEKRYTLAFGQQLMSIETYGSVMRDLQDRQNSLRSTLAQAETTKSDTCLPEVDELVDGVMAVVSTLDYSDKRRVLLELVEKVVATKAEATVTLAVNVPRGGVWTTDVDVPGNSRSNKVTDENAADASTAAKKVALRHGHADTDGVTLPFEIKVRLPQWAATPGNE